MERPHRIRAPGRVRGLWQSQRPRRLHEWPAGDDRRRARGGSQHLLRLGDHACRILPDLFREGQGIVAMGSINDRGMFEADEVLAKHDEEYMPPEVADALKAAEDLAKQKAAQKAALEAVNQGSK